MTRGSVPVGSSTTQPLFFSIASGTTVGSISIVTQGASGLDFLDGGSSTCTAQTYSAQTDCVVNVKFAPGHPGVRMGAVVFSDAGGATLATVLTGSPVIGIVAAAAFGAVLALFVVAAAGISPDDLLITLYETPGENISFGRGLAQRAHISEKGAKAAAVS